MNIVKIMNLSVVKKLGAKAFLKAKEISPELALGAGILCGVGAIVTACIATRKVDEVIADVNYELDIADAHMENASTKAEEKEAKKEMMDAWAGAAWKFTKLYGPSLILAGSSVALVLTSHGILKSRYLSTAAAYKALDEAYKAYRERVEHDLGYGAGEKAIAAGVKYKEDISVENEDGTVEKKDHGLVMDDKKSPYEFDFNRFTAPQTWSSNPSDNDILLKVEQNYANDLLHTRGYIFLNEVLDRLGLERTSAGQLVGWYMGAGDDQVDFGYLDGFIKDWNIDSDLCKKNIRLNFNCDGIIYDMLRKKT